MSRGQVDGTMNNKDGVPYFYRVDITIPHAANDGCGGETLEAVK